MDPLQEFEVDGRFSIDTLISHIASLCVAEESEVCSIPKFWARYIKLPRPPNDVVYFAQVRDLNFNYCSDSSLHVYADVYQQGVDILSNKGANTSKTNN